MSTLLRGFHYSSIIYQIFVINKCFFNRISETVGVLLKNQEGERIYCILAKSTLQKLMCEEINDH